MIRTSLPARLAAAAACLTTTLALDLPTASATDVPNGTIATFFTHPLDGVSEPGAPSEITAEIVNLLNHAASTATVEIAVYLVKYDGSLNTAVGDVQLIKNAIAQAAGRGVAIKILTDSPTTDTTALATQLKNMSGVTVKQCDHGCYSTSTTVNGDPVINHNKFMLIDKVVFPGGNLSSPVPVDGNLVLNDVVFQMTSNWTNEQLSSHHWNSAVEFNGDTVLYAGYDSYFDSMWACAPSGSCGSPPTSGFNGFYGSHVDVFPRTSDPILNELQNVTCPSDVDIVVNEWSNDTRGQALVNALLNLRPPDDLTQECTIRIVVPRDAGILGNDDFFRLEFGQGVHCTDDGDSGLDLNEPPTGLLPHVHSKYMLIGGTYDDAVGSRMVFMGSETFRSKAKSDDDNTWVTVTPEGVTTNGRMAEVYNDYLADFNAMWAATPSCFDLDAA